jgi:phage baseplate assembly protein W
LHPVTQNSPRVRLKLKTAAQVTGDAARLSMSEQSTTAMALNGWAARLDLNSVTMCKGEV